MMPRTLLLEDRATTLAGIACLAGLGLFLAFAVFVPIAEGVTVGGQIVVEDKRKVVQHLEGGIIRDLAVREGSVVSAGDTLVVIEDVQARAERDQTGQVLLAVSATLDRIETLLADGDEIIFRPVPGYDGDADKRAGIRAEARQLFDRQRQALASERSVLEARRLALVARADAQAAQGEAIGKSLSILRAEVENKRPLLAQNDITIDAIQGLDREIASLEGALAGAKADRLQALAEAAEVEERIMQAGVQFQERLSAELIDARTEYLSRQEQFLSMQNILERTVIKAPQTGRVMNLNFATVGGVVRPGDPILEIVPAEGSLVAQVQVSPTDRDTVYEGLAVKARLSAYRQWRTPVVDGEVLSVSADLKTTRDGKQSYYEALIRLDAGSVAAAEDVDIVPGMPVEAFVDSGRKRTFLSYLFEPIVGTLDKGVGRG